MMEPRWSEARSAMCEVFVGGVDRFDLWVSGDQLDPGYLSVAWGPATPHWTRYPIEKGKIGPPDFFEDGNPTEEELKLIEHYLRLFAPWVLATKEAA